MPAVGSAFVELVLDNTGFNRGLTASEAKLQSFGGTAGKSMIGFQKVATAAFAGAAVAAGAFAVQSIKAYEQHQVALGQLQNQISKMPSLVGASAKAFDDQAKALAEVTGADRDAIIAGDSVLAQFKLTQQQIQQLIPLVVDYARRTGQDIPAAASGVGRALLGNTRALKTVGIQFKATGDRGKDLSSVMDLLKSHVGGAAEAFGNTAQGKIARFHEQLKNVEIEAGHALMPVLEGMVGALSGVVSALDKVPAPLRGLAGAAIAAALAFKGLNVALGLFGVELGAAAGPLGVVTVGLAGFAFALAQANSEANKQFAAMNRDIAAVQQYGASTKQGAAATADFSAQMHSAYGRLAGFSAAASEFRGRMLAATGAIRGATGTANTFEHSIKGATDAMGAATGEAARLRAALAALHDKNIYVRTYYYEYHIPGGNQVRKAHGGVFAAAGGASFMSPRGAPFIAGEGGYATPAGIGSELVGSRGILPLDYGTFDKIGGALARHLRQDRGGGPNVQVIVNGVVGSPRDVAITISRELAKLSNVKRI